MKYCKKCILPSTRPNIVFDNQGKCCDKTTFNKIIQLWRNMRQHASFCFNVDLLPVEISDASEIRISRFWGISKCGSHFDWKRYLSRQGSQSHSKSCFGFKIKGLIVCKTYFTIFRDFKSFIIVF